MAEYLVMRLYGPMASWGEIAVGEKRHSADHPSRSALLGLLAAALGVERDDIDAQQRLADGYRFGIKLECAGSLVRDYHTVQSGVRPRKGKFRTRRQELAAEKRNTYLSEREYRCDSLSVVAIEASASAPYSLDQLAKALDSPRFSPYLGRKSCPLALPIWSRVIAAETVREALDVARFPSLLALTGRDPGRIWPTESDKWTLRPGSARYYWEDEMQAGMGHSFETVRHDQPTSRRRWQFAPRREWVRLEDEEVR